MAPLIPEAAWRKGTQWAAVTRAHAALFVHDDAVFRVMRRHCATWTDPEGRYAAFCAGDEHFKQVVIQLAVRGAACAPCGACCLSPPLTRVAAPAGPGRGD